MGFFDRARNFVTGRGWTDTPAAAREPAAVVERRGGLGGFIDRVTGADRRREEEARERQQAEHQAQERAEVERARQELEQQRAELERQRQEQERQVQEQRQELERQRQEFERQRQEQERQAQERQVQERERIEREVREQIERERQQAERQEREREEWRRDLGIDREVTGGKEAGASWTLYTVRTPDELMERLREAADAGKRVGFSVHDANGWHHVYTNPGRGTAIDPVSGMTVGGGAGMSASELLERLETYGVPGAESAGAGGYVGGGISPEPGAGLPEMEAEGVISGPEWEYDGGDYDGDYYDYIDESDGGDEGDTEGYDPGSVNGYQLVVY